MYINLQKKIKKEICLLKLLLLYIVRRQKSLILDSLVRINHLPSLSKFWWEMLKLMWMEIWKSTRKSTANMFPLYRRVELEESDNLYYNFVWRIKENKLNFFSKSTPRAPKFWEETPKKYWILILEWIFYPSYCKIVILYEIWRKLI